MATCRLCKGEAEKVVGDVCVRCLGTLGVVELPPPRRKADPCTRCNGLRFVRVVPREYTAERNVEKPGAVVEPMTLTQAPLVEKNWILRGNTVHPPRIGGGFGVLETYTCLGCGFVEWYCQNPDQIPIGPEYMSELIDHTPDAPYR